MRTYIKIYTFAICAIVIIANAQAVCQNSGDPIWVIESMTPTGLGKVVRTAAPATPGSSECPAGTAPIVITTQTGIQVDVISVQYQTQVGTCPNDYCPPKELNTVKTTAWKIIDTSKETECDPIA